MKASKFTEAQIAFVLKEADEGSAVAEVCRKSGISEATFYVWWKKYGNLLPTEMKRLRQLEDENASEVALIDFDLTCKERSFSRYILNDDLTQFVEKQNCCVSIYTRQLSSRSRGNTN